MSEYLGNFETEPEISDAEKGALLRRVRDMAPYENQPFDHYGHYVTRIVNPDGGFTALLIPVPADPDETDPNMYDGRVYVINHIPEVTDGVTVVYMNSYAIHEDTLAAEYEEAIRLFDTETNRPLGPRPDEDMQSFLAAFNLEQQFKVSPVFTADRLEEVTILLDTLDPNDTL